MTVHGDVARLVLGFGSDSNDRIVGTVKLGRAREGDSASQILQSASRAGWVEVLEPVFSNADQVGPLAGERIEVWADQVRWCAKWDDFRGVHALQDEASRS